MSKLRHKTQRLEEDSLCLFDLQDLYDLKPTQRFEAIFSAIDINPILAVLRKRSRFGRPVELNCPAMVYSLVARIIERIPTVKDLIKRLKQDMIFSLDCDFLVSDTIPSEAAYSRMVTILSESNALEESQNTLLHQAITEGFVKDDTAAVDVAGKQMYFPYRLYRGSSKLFSEDMDKQPIGRINIEPDFQYLAINYGPMTEPIPAVPIAQIDESDIEQLQQIGEKVWHNLLFEDHYLQVHVQLAGDDVYE